MSDVTTENQGEQAPKQEPLVKPPAEEAAKPKTRRHLAVKIARGGLTAVVGAGLVGGGTFLGYEFASIGAEQQSLGQVADTVGKYLGAVVGGALGAMATVEVAPFVAGD